MKIDLTTAGDVTVLTFTGEFDAFNLEKVRERIDGLIDEGSRKVVFDMGGLSFIGSPPLGYVLGTHERLKDQSGELVLARLSPPVRSTLDTLNLTQHFTIFDTPQAAVLHLSQ